MTGFFIKIPLLLIILNIASAQEEYGGNLRYAETEFPRTFDPVTSIDDAANDRLTAMMFESLFNLDIHREIRKDLAQSYSIGGDNRSITVTLKDGVRWSDGSPITTFDIQKTIEALRLSENVNVNRRVEIIRDVDVNNYRNITFHFKNAIPENVMLRILTFKILNGSQLSNLPLTVQSEIARQPVASGYYTITSRGPNYLRLHANTHYRSRAGGSVGPFIDEITTFILSDRGTQVDFLQGNQVDVLIDVPVEALAQLRAGGFQIRPYESLSFQFIAFNFKNYLLQNRNIRQAMVYGFNRDNALDRIYQRQGDLISGPFPPASSYYVRGPDTQPIRYEPFTAMELLEAAGFTVMDSDGVRSNVNGEILEFNLIAPRYEGDDYTRRVIAQFITDMRRIGIKINIVDMEFQIWLRRIRYEQNFDLAYAAIAFDEVSDVSPLFDSRNSKPGGDNFISYNNPIVDQLIDRLRQTTDHHELVNINRRLHRIVREDCPYIFLWSLKKNAAANQRVRNFMTRVTPYSFFDYVNEWYIRE